MYYKFKLSSLMANKSGGISNLTLSSDTGLSMATIAKIRANKIKQLDIGTVAILFEYFGLTGLDQLVTVESPNEIDPPH